MNFLKTLFAFGLFFTALSASEHSSFIRFLPATTEFAWDCHQVLVKPRIGTLVKIGILEGAPKILRVTGALCCESLKYCWKGTPSRTFALLKAIVATLKIKKVTAEDFKDLLNAYDASLWPLILKMASQQTPNRGMQEIVDMLHRLGYTQRVATNMSREEFASVKERNPELYKNFEEGLTIDVSQDNFPRKPDSAYFEEYQRRYNPNGTKKIIFIDDKLSNVRSAENVGMIGIHFKNVGQLCIELEKMDIVSH